MAEVKKSCSQSYFEPFLSFLSDNRWCQDRSAGDWRVVAGSGDPTRQSTQRWPNLFLSWGCWTLISFINLNQNTILLSFTANNGQHSTGVCGASSFLYRLVLKTPHLRLFPRPQCATLPGVGLLLLWIRVFLAIADCLLLMVNSLPNISQSYCQFHCLDF